MVACATNKNNSKRKKMKTIDEDTAPAPNNPIEEGNFSDSFRRTNFQEGNNRNQT